MNGKTTINAALNASEVKSSPTDVTNFCQSCVSLQKLLSEAIDKQEGLKEVRVLKAENEEAAGIIKALINHGHWNQVMPSGQVAVRRAQDWLTKHDERKKT